MSYKLHCSWLNKFVKINDYPDPMRREIYKRLTENELQATDKKLAAQVNFIECSADLAIA